MKEAGICPRLYRLCALLLATRLFVTVHACIEI